MHPCPVVCFLTLGVRTPVPCYARKYFSSFCFVVLRFLTLGVCTVSRIMFSNTWRTHPCLVLCPLILQLLLFCGVMFSNTRRTTPSRQYLIAFVLWFYVFQHLSYAPLSRLMPANTSTAVALWCCVFQHLAYAPLSRVARQYFNNFCVCSVVLCCPTLGVRPRVPRYARHNTNCMNRPGKPCRVQS
jgi:hypothetical protein